MNSLVRFSQHRHSSLPPWSQDVVEKMEIQGYGVCSKAVLYEAAGLGSDLKWVLAEPLLLTLSWFSWCSRLGVQASSVILTSLNPLKLIPTSDSNMSKA